MVITVAVAVAVVGLSAAWLFMGGNGEALGEWQNETGGVVNHETVRAFNGGGHCGWESATVLRVDAGLLDRNPETGDGGGVVFFVRDPQHVVDAGLLGEYAFRDDLPDGAVPSGLSAGDTELWFGADGRTALLMNSDGVEVWPRARGAVACG